MKLTIQRMRDLASHLESSMRDGGIADPSDRWFFETIKEWVVSELDDEASRYAHADFRGGGR